MRSWLSLALLCACTKAPAATGDAGVPDATACDQSYLTYDNFGEPFMSNWCRGCHSSAIPMTADPDMRQGAPPSVNFDTAGEVGQFRDQVLMQAAGDPTQTPKPMPPAGGPPAAERALLAEWITCGLK